MMWFMALLLVVFTAGCDRDHGAAAPPAGPTVTSVTPVNASTGIAINRTVTATFSEPMSGATVTAPGTFTVTGPFVTPVTGTITYDVPSRTATFTPSANLLNNTTYTATISVGAENPAGTALASSFVWSFSTALTPDTTAPVVSFTAPASNELGVLVNRKIVATFNEAMDPTTIIGANVLVTGPTGTVSGAVTYAAGSFAMTFTPAVNLATSATYTVTITGPAGVKDQAVTGNFMAANYIWSFSTALTPDLLAPQISLTNPADLAVNVPTDKKVNATFTKTMDPLTITTANFTLKEGLIPITGTVAYDLPTNIATFTPLSLLTPSTTYTAQVTIGAKDLAGNALVSGLVPNPWTFTTAPVVGPLILIDLGLAAPFGIASAGGVTNTPTVPITHINGDVVLHPTYTCNGVPILFADGPGFGLCNTPAQEPPTISGTVVTSVYPDTVTAIAVLADLLSAYDSISPANLPGATVLGCGTIGDGGDAGALIGCAGNATLPPGTYISATASTIGVTGVLTLDGQGDVNSQFIFQAPSALTTAAGTGPGIPGSQILLINGAKASNVWWWVGGSGAATIGTYADFQGNILGSGAIVMGTGATSCGRLLAGALGAGNFVFDSNLVSVPGNGCPL
jgi:hypothetical protein